MDKASLNLLEPSPDASHDEELQPLTDQTSRFEGKKQELVHYRCISSAKILAFIANVFLAITTQVTFKLSQNRHGAYEYNTMSAMTVAECMKLIISVVHHMTADKALDMQVSGIAQELLQVDLTVYQTYFLMAVSYAVYNQLVFAVMVVAEPGTFSLLKSFTPAIVSIINCIFGYGNVLTYQQFYAVLIQVFGIITVIGTSAGAGSFQSQYDLNEVLLLLITVAMGSINTVYNAKVVKELSLSITLQNMILYLFGAITNFCFYLIFSTPDTGGFFHGYHNCFVILLLLLNSFLGIAITALYKYGDATLKTLSGPLSSSILVYISYLCFDMTLDIVKAAGAAVVVIDTLLYLSLPSSGSESNGVNTSSSSRPLHNLNKDSPRTKNKGFVMKLLCAVWILFGLVGFQVFFLPQYNHHTTTSTTIESKITKETNNSKALFPLPIILIVQGLRLEPSATDDNITSLQSVAINKEKLNIFEIYSQHFAHVVYDTPLYNPDRNRPACSDPAFDGLDADCRYCSFTRPLVRNKWDDHRYACTADIMNYFAGDNNIMGVLVIHADLYLLPNFIDQAAAKTLSNPDSFWLLNMHSNQSFTVEQFPKQGWAWPIFWPQAEAARKGLSNLALSSHVAPDDIFLRPVESAGWVDLYYTPKPFWEHFIPMSHIMMEHRVVNEIAIPYIHHMVSKWYNLDPGMGINCMGDCCSSPLVDHLNSSAVDSTPCGHRIDLASSSERQSLLDVWRNHTWSNSH